MSKSFSCPCLTEWMLGCCVVRHLDRIGYCRSSRPGRCHGLPEAGPQSPGARGDCLAGRPVGKTWEGNARGHLGPAGTGIRVPAGHRVSARAFHGKRSGGSPQSHRGATRRLGAKTRLLRHLPCPPAGWRQGVQLGPVDRPERASDRPLRQDPPYRTGAEERFARGQSIRPSSRPISG